MRLVMNIARAMFATVVCMSDAVADQWDDAAKTIVRLAPSEFPGVPRRVLDALNAEGCTVPQVPLFSDKPHNLIRGHFASRRQVDYATLCSKDGSSHLMIVWGGAVRCPSHMEASEDRSQLQQWAPGIIYSRAIDPATQKTIAYFRELEGPAPPDRMHEGIEEINVGKASVIWYCAKGQWHTLQGMD